MSNRTVALGCAIVVLGVAGCAKDDSSETTTRSTMTERQKDSLIARSPIPGAKAVQKSMNVADSASARSMRAVDTSQ